MLQVYTDAAFEPTTTKASIAYVVKDFSSKEVILQQALLVTAADNHQAEFYALLHVVQALRQAGLQQETIQFNSDSKALILAVDKNYSKKYPELLAAITAELKHFPFYYTKLIADNRNIVAHQLAIKKLHEKI